MKKLEDMHPVSLCILPTPLVEMPVLSAKLGGPRILVKRDDLTGLAMGGHKSRIFEFVLREAKDMGADVVLIAYGPHDNPGPQVAAGARKLGMDVIMLALKDEGKVEGNFLLNNLLSEIKETAIEYYGRAKVSIEMLVKQVEEQLEALAAELRSKGRRPYIVSPLGSILFVFGYASMVAEVCKQLQERGLTAQYLFASSATAHTHAGLILGAKYAEAPFKIVGVLTTDLFFAKEKLARNVTDLVNKAAKLLEMNFTLTPDEVILDDGYIGEDYKIPPKKSIEAIKLVAQTEGFFLDPLYTGRTMAALIDQVREGKIKRGDTVIFYHSGGLPLIFHHSDLLL